MGIKVKDTIKEIVREHLATGGIALGQCLTAVGWVGGTLPELYEEDGMIELPTCDVAGGAIATGFALANKRPIYITRYQGFQWYNCVSVINYAAKAKEMWGTPCPIFMRSIAMEGGIGPVASNCHHGIFTRMPGIKVFAPMTSLEYKQIWEQFLSDDVPYYISEHRSSFEIDYEMPPIVHQKAALTLLPISVTRINARKAIQNLSDIQINICDLIQLSPFIISDEIVQSINNSKFGALILDDDYTNGTAKSIAYDLSKLTDKPINILGLEERVAGFGIGKDNLAPSSEKIQITINKILGIA